VSKVNNIVNNELKLLTSLCLSRANRNSRDLTTFFLLFFKGGICRGVGIRRGRTIGGGTWTKSPGTIRVVSRGESEENANFSISSVVEVVCDPSQFDLGGIRQSGGRRWWWWLWW
jgi:hypothetical protein